MKYLFITFLYCIGYLFIYSYTTLWAHENTGVALELHYIDTSRVGFAMPDSSAAIDMDGDGNVEILTSMQNIEGYPEILLYKLNDQNNWKRTVIGVIEIKEEIEWIAVGRPFPEDPRICIAASVQHQHNGLVVLRLREYGLDPFDANNWEQGAAKDFAGQGLSFQDLDGDGVDELIYATQAGNELGILKAIPHADHMTKDGWVDFVIDSGADRAWWWLNDKYYDLNNNGHSNDFFATTRLYGGHDVGIWMVIQEKPNDLSSYKVHKIYHGDSLWFDTGYFFSDDKKRIPDIVMVEFSQRNVKLLNAIDDYAVTKIPIKGTPWNVKVLPFLGRERDGFVVATAQSESLFWSFQYINSMYKIFMETGYEGEYHHPMDGTFTVADIYGDGSFVCIVPDSSLDKRSKGLAYLKYKTRESDSVPYSRFKLQ